MNAATAEDDSGARNSSPRRLVIVIADDDRDTILTLQTLLREEGHTVYAAYRGDEVIRLARQVQPDAVILDIAMPGESGFSVAQEMRTNYYGIRKPLLIAISGQYKSGSDRLLAQMVGFDHHLIKPADPLQIIGLLGRLTLPPDTPPA